MEQSLFYRVKELFPGSVTVNNSAFKVVKTGGKSAHFTAEFETQTARAELTGANCAHFHKDCFKSLSPVIHAA